MRVKQSQLTLLKALQEGETADLENSEPTDLAETYVIAAFFTNMMCHLRDRLWLFCRESDQGPQDFLGFLRRAFGSELAPISFLSPVVNEPSRGSLKRLEAQGKSVVSEISRIVASYEVSDYRLFLKDAMLKMAELSRFESSLKFEGPFTPASEPLDNSLYRTFDAMDDILGIEYSRDRGMKFDPTRKERLYEGAGAGVQTSYGSLLIALDKIRPAQGARVIDLGSGYGRVGFVIGLLRPDIQFTGYEFVGHRVESAQSSAMRAGISDHVRFITQDLSDKEFVIPEAEVYYMYDPFTNDTYHHVFQRLKEIARDLPITIVTKGNAADRFLETVFDEEQWMKRESFDSGTLSLFRSRPIANPFGSVMKN